MFVLKMTESRREEKCVTEKKIEAAKGGCCGECSQFQVKERCK